MFVVANILLLRDMILCSLFVVADIMCMIIICGCKDPQYLHVSSPYSYHSRNRVGPNLKD